MQRYWREAGMRNGCWTASRGCAGLVIALFMGVRRMRSWREIGGVWKGWWKEMTWRHGLHGEVVYGGRKSEGVRFGALRKDYESSNLGSNTCSPVVNSSHLATDPAFTIHGKPYPLDCHDDGWSQLATVINSALASVRKNYSINDNSSMQLWDPSTLSPEFFALHLAMRMCQKASSLIGLFRVYCAGFSVLLICFTDRGTIFFEPWLPFNFILQIYSKYVIWASHGWLLQRPISGVTTLSYRMSVRAHF